MQLKRLIFILCIIFISITCIAVMNFNHDRLSRYSYTNEQHRQIIDEHLTNEEIEYIIEWQIQPTDFIDYIYYEDFSIYHANEYRQLQNHYLYYAPKDIVKMVEETFGILTVEQLADYLFYYDYYSILYYINGDYFNELELVENPNDIDVVINQNNYLSKRKPLNNDLVLIDQIKTFDDQQIYISKRVYPELTKMCEAISSDLNMKNCANMIVENGYISYDKQNELYLDGMNVYGKDVDKYVFMAGHSEAQLGLSLDFMIKGYDDKFKTTKQYEWLNNNAHMYGFYQSYNENNQNLTNMFSQDNHFRYVGTELATSLYESEHKGEIVNE